MATTATTEKPAATTPAAATTGTAPATPATPTTPDSGTTGTTAATSTETPKPGETTPVPPVATPKAPDKYVLTLPEGGRVDATDIGLVETMARANNWDNARAQAALEGLDETLVEQSSQFLTETKADKTYGGAKLEESQRLAALVLDKVRPTGTPRGDAFRRLLDKGGYGNNLEVLSFLTDLGKMMDEDTPASGGPGGSVKKDAADVLYGADKK
jgi:hypothetical protein